MIRAAFAAALLGLGAMTSPPAVAAQDPAIPRPEHPEPMAVREHWANLNGDWQFRFDPEDAGLDAEWFAPGAEGYDREIVVPFAWESRLSGIGEIESPDVGWYRRTFAVPDAFPDDHRVWLRFGAVDYEADVWVNGTKVAEHEGGYTPFEADVTDALNDDGSENVVVVRADDPTDPSLPTGKQVGWYTPTSGIWQTVWLEARPEQYIDTFTIRTEIDPAKLRISAIVRGSTPEDGLSVAIDPDDPDVEAASAAVSRIETYNGAHHVTVDGAHIEASVRNAKLWSPESPHLYNITLQLKDADGNVVDSVATYFGLRTIARGTYGDEPYERFLLNGKPIYIRSALDQSFNPEGLYTGPSDEFIRNDVAMARYMGLNGIRIHIKTEEPRRLYWADKYGLLVMQDIPNTWRQDARARESWEHGMREAVARDRNHPSIWSWVAFNETWGLGDGRDRAAQYKADEDTQRWVSRMVDEVRALDPTRLVEDNSPCNYDHVENTDINSWHFYIDNYENAKRHIAEVVASTEPGSGFNYCPGLTQGTAPLMNSEYGSVSAGGGDRDISWGFRYLTTLLRMQEKIQGYVYTELTDIEWEHNGYADYERTPKFYGYDAFLPDMRVSELNQADFVGADAPPVIVARPGETIEVPVFISHFSDRDFEPTLRWWVQGVDETGDEPMIVPQRSVPATWEQYGVTWQEPVRFTAPDEPFVGALMLTVRDPQNARIAGNYVNLVVRGDEPPARVERRNEREAVLRFDPESYAASRWDEPAEGPEGKVYGHGAGSFEYRIAVPDSIVESKPEYLYLTVEAAAKARRERVDWPERVNAQDYPQTDVDAFPTTLVVTVNGAPFETEAEVEAEGKGDVLETDPADARGVLSHLAGVEHGSHGYLLLYGVEVDDELRSSMEAGEPLSIRFEVPADAEHVGGLAIYGDTMGQFPVDPTLTVVTADELPEDLGVDPATPVAVDSVAARRVLLLPSGDDRGRAEPATWAYTTDDPGDGWQSPDFDASGWKTGPGGFGTRMTPAVRVNTRWNTPTIWLRGEFDLPESVGPDDALTLHLFHDEGVEVFVNGTRVFAAEGYVTAYGDHRLDDDAKSAFRPGRNVVAVRCRQTGGGQGVDVGLRFLRAAQGDPAAD